MECNDLRSRFENAKNSIIEKLSGDPKCLAAFLYGSMSHDVVWEWSDLQIHLVYDDSYKGPSNYSLLEHEVCISLTIQKRSEFKQFLESSNVSDYFYCALSKSTPLFYKDPILKEYFEDIFYIGDRDREVEMLLGFSEAVYYLNKAEKNYVLKKNNENAIYFIFHIALGIAWLEVARSRCIPEREIISQAKKLKPALFEKIYDPLFYQQVSDVIIEEILAECKHYLNENTLEVYRPIISYLKQHGTLKNFSMKTRNHGFGINYDWLCRVGIAEMYIEPIKINGHDSLFYPIGLRLRDE